MIFWNILGLIIISTRGIFGDESSTSSSRNLEIFSGFQLDLNENELKIKLDPSKIFEMTAVQSRHDHQEDDKKTGLMERFGSIIYLIPLMMQMFTLPGAIASIKMSLLKSLAVAKLAVLLMIFNMLKNQQLTQVVVVRQTPQQHHDHYYSPFHEENEDDDKGWFG